MASLDARVPVIVGAGQVTHRDRAREPDPLTLMVEASRRAAEDCGAAGLLDRAQSVAAVDVFSWPIPDPAREVAQELRLEPAETVVSTRGGTSPAELLADLCTRIANGDLDVALLVGGEAVNPFMRARSAGAETGWSQQPEGTRPSRVVGSDREATHPLERDAGLIAPIFYYPWFETAVRAAAGRDPGAHNEWLGRLWGRFAAVARDSPHAWIADPPGAETIATAGPGNRMVAHPYPKLMTANIQVDQAAAMIVCSAEAARQAGMPRERWTFVHATASAHDRWFACERAQLHRSPAIAACGRAALAHASIGIEDVEHLDLYSCFPSAVQVAATELGIDLERDSRPPTVTGGLTFAGGPASNYVTHALATLARRLRERGGHGLATGVGWYLTKHAVVVLGADPPARAYAHHSMQEEVDRVPGREAVAANGAPLDVEAYTAIYDRDGEPTLGIVSGLLADGRRALGKVEDRAAISELLAR